MPTITRIAQQKDQNRANIYLDGKFSFGISIESLLSHGLKTNQELSREKIEELKEEDKQVKLFNYVINFATIRPRSEREIKLWFKRKKVEEKAQDTLLLRLKRLNLINDEAFASWWVEQRTIFRPKSERALKAELFQKGINKEVVEKVLGEAEVPEEEIALKLAQKRLSRLKSLSYLDKKRKLAEFLGRRGFSWDVIRPIIDQILQK